MSRFMEVMKGGVSKKIANFWFTLLGYIGAIAAIEFVGVAVNSWLIVTVSKLSYVFLFLWLQASINHATWWAVPSYNPDNMKDDLKPGVKKAWFGGKMSAIICILLYWFVTHVVEVVVSAQNA
jgi:hypothetical protein